MAVAAGFAPISIATESNGSIVYPAGRTGLYGLKLTVGAVPCDGCQANSEWIFGAGAMAKSTLEVSDTVSALLQNNDLSPYLTGSWDGIRVGFVDFRVWRPHPDWVEAHNGYFQQQASLPFAQRELALSNKQAVYRTNFWRGPYTRLLQMEQRLFGTST